MSDIGRTRIKLTDEDMEIFRRNLQRIARWCDEAKAPTQVQTIVAIGCARDVMHFGPGRAR